MKKYIVIDPKDSVAVALETIAAGEAVAGVTARQDIPAGHKIALHHIKKGETVYKYGAEIGKAIGEIQAGEHIHTNNLSSALGKKEYEYCKKVFNVKAAPFEACFNGYRRKDGRAGVRNYLYIVVTVGCINGLAKKLEVYGNSIKADYADAVVAVTHPFGCSQLGDDHTMTQKLLAGIIRNPNAGGTLVLGLGCENNNIAKFKKILGETEGERIKFLNAQDSEDELEEGKYLIQQILKTMSLDKRTKIDISELAVGVKCGGSDGLSGITANPLIGRVSDVFTSAGAKLIMTEVPEMFGAEDRLFERAKDKQTFMKGVEMINGFKDYFCGYGVPIYENPSPGNKKGGITTLEEKSLGCTQKSGCAEVVAVIDYAEEAVAPGLTLLSGPGNDIVAVSALAAAGATLILFSTGRGTPLGSVVPVIKISSNTPLAQKKPNWIDFDAGTLLQEEAGSVTSRLIDKIIKVANGAATNSEQNCNYDFAIFKRGVTL